MQLGLGDIGGDMGNIEGTSIFGSGRSLNWVVGGKIRNYANEVAAIPSDSLWKASINQITLEGDNSKYKVDRTEDHHFTILTSHTSQQVEFFHSSMFC